MLQPRQLWQLSTKTKSRLSSGRKIFPKEEEHTSHISLNREHSLEPPQWKNTPNVYPITYLWTRDTKHYTWDISNPLKWRINSKYSSLSIRILTNKSFLCILQFFLNFLYLFKYLYVFTIFDVIEHFLMEGNNSIKWTMTPRRKTTRMALGEEREAVAATTEGLGLAWKYSCERPRLCLGAESRGEK